MMAAPPAATSVVWPDWANGFDTWREQDAEWLRNRIVGVFPDAGSASGRDTIMNPVAKSYGMMSILQSGSVAGGPDFWNGAAWESIRYPNLNVTSDANGVTLKRQGAGTGIQLLTDGSVNMAKAFVGTGGVGSTLDNTGVAVKIGAKTVKLATDATQLTIDSPVSIAGGLTLTGALSVPSATVTGGLTVQGNTSVQGLAAASVAATGLVAGGSVNGGDAQLATVGVYGTLRHRVGGTAAVGVGSDSTVKIDGTSVAVNPPTTFAGVVNVNGQTNFVGRPFLAFTAVGANVPTWVAGIYAVSGNVAPSQACPDGTIYITY
jgi:hypothetical protein